MSPKPRNTPQVIKLAHKGDMHAQYTLGYCYYYGISVMKDKKEGVKWMKKSAAQGCPEATEALKRIEALRQDIRSRHPVRNLAKRS